RARRGVWVTCLLVVAASARAQGVPPDSSGAVHDTAAVAPVAAPTMPGSQAAPADTGLGGFLKRLSDSTNVYFGPSAAPVDTVGLDSTLAFRLANPELLGDMRHQRPSWSPWFTFNRADGALY